MSTVFEPSKSEERWLECQIEKGMFSDEMAVTYPPEGDMQKSVFVSSSVVDGLAGQRGRVLVRVVKRDGSTIAVLPSPNQDIVYARPEDISDR